MTVRRLATILVLALLGAAVSASTPAPARSTHPPRATDFSQPVPRAVTLRPALARATAGSERDHSQAGHHGPVIYRTRPIDAPHRFDLVGVVKATSAYEYRARADGGEWSDWAEADDGNPVYTGDSDQVQIRSREAPIRGRLLYVRVVESTLPVASRAAAAKADEPDFVTRREWGAKQKKGGCEPRTRPEMGKVKAGVIHHTVSTNTYTEAEAPGIVLGICRFHRNGNGWNDIGYNALVDRFGNVYQGRAGGMARPVIGAQAEGVNSQTTGVAGIGDFTQKKPSRAMQKGIVDYLAWKFEVSGVTATGNTRLTSAGGETQKTPKGQRVKVKKIFNHGTTNYTACAGKRMNELVPKLRREVQAKLGER